jgi:membrane-associated HD superfamily phosphohydrolase
MKKIDPVVIKETLRILIGSIALGAIMNVVFLMLRCWNLPVLFGTLLGTAGAVLNFFLMAQTVSHSVTLQQDEVKRKVRFSHSLRTLMLLVLMILGVVLSCFNTIAVLVPFLFPRLIIAAYRLTHREDFQTDGGSDK